MSAAAREGQSKPAARKSPPRLPKNAATLRRVHRALHDFVEHLRGKLERAVHDARARQLGAARHVEQVCCFLLHRQGKDAAELTAPTGWAVNADLAIGLRHVDLLALTERVDAWTGVINELAAYEGVAFKRKRPAVGGSRKRRREDDTSGRDAENRALSSLEREAGLLLGIFSDAVGEFERRLSAQSTKRKSKAERPSGRLTPPQVADRLGVSADKVRSWIASNELPATNVASAAANRPRWRIDEKDLENFEQRRQPAKPPPAPRRRRRKKDPNEKDYFPDVPG